MSTLRARVLQRLILACWMATSVALLLPASANTRQASAPAAAESEGREALNRGIQAFRNGQQKEAEQFFAQAKELDPHSIKARLCLATAYASQYIPGASGEENMQSGRRAIEEFKGVLDLDPQNLSALDGVGSIMFQVAGQPFNPDLFAEAKSYFQRHVQIQPNDSEPYYWTGVIDWTLAFRANQQLRAWFNDHVSKLDAAEPLPADLRERYALAYGTAIQEGMESMEQAIKLRPDYDDAMAYLNLLYRREADVVADEGERSKLLKVADDLVDKVKDIKEQRAKLQQGIKP